MLKKYVAYLKFKINWVSSTYLANFLGDHIHSNQSDREKR